MSDAASARFTNRLAGEKSPYLRQHAHNPVDWFPWGEEAFARARAEQKPIFLSVGYSTCHWCHVMAHESFEDEAVAGRLNRDFVPVKVDREERPDVDRLYMTYVQAATGQGGWPMSVWLTPDLKPFYGGTYFPPEDRWGRPGFATLLGVLAQAWANDRAKLMAEGERVAAALRQHAERHALKSRISDSVGPGDGDAESGGAKKIARERGIQSSPPKAGDRGSADAFAPAFGAAFDRCFQQLAASFDPVHGGFGGAPKFPRGAVFSFLFRTAAGKGGASAVGARAVQMAAHTLRKMAEGGLHDHVGGGFHRYAVDEEWFVPHFEKMLYDQAQLAWSYLEARQATGDERYAWVARGIFDYVRRDLTNPAGGFYSAEDADSPPPAEGQGEGRKSKVEGQQAEGAFYVWTKTEIGRALGTDAEMFCDHFGVEDDGNVPGGRDPHGEFRGKNILRQRRPLAETAQRSGLAPEAAAAWLQACLIRLCEARAQRPRPHLDDKILAAWNGLMISALAKGHQVLGERNYLEQAVRAAAFLRKELFDGRTGTLYRSYCEGRSDIPGFAEDYAYLIQGLLDLYEASFEVGWLQWAERLQAKMDELFWDARTSGYFNSRAGDPSIIARLKEDYDGAEPAPVSVAVGNLLRLDAMIGDGAADKRPMTQDSPGYRARAMRCLEATQRQWAEAPQALPQLLGARELALTPPRTVVLAGDPEAHDFAALVAVLHERLGPRWALLAADGGEGQRWLAARRPYLAEMAPQNGRATAYVCNDFACQPPVTQPAALRRLLWE
ncbi:MAG TPA: thioredoxin domain-containing protein [Opitutaceae bacterium]|nr:thioredoxin domain-containing protein [Opitutaceae bacterium]